MQVDPKSLELDLKPAGLSGLLQSHQELQASIPPPSPESLREQQSFRDVGTLSVSSFVGLASGAPQTDRHLSNGRSLLSRPGPASRRASPDPGLAHASNGDEEDVHGERAEERQEHRRGRRHHHHHTHLDRSSVTWSPELDQQPGVGCRGWESSGDRKREAESENHVGVKRVKTEQQEPDDGGPQPQGTTDKPSPTQTTTHMHSFHGLSLPHVAARSTMTALHHHPTNTGCNPARTHSSPPGDLLLYPGAERFPYRALPWVPLAEPLWDMYRGAELRQEAVARAKPLHVVMDSRLEAEWSHRPREPVLHHHPSSLALLQQERVYLREQEQLHMLRENSFQYYGQLHPLHSHLTPPSLLAPSYPRVSQMGLSQTLQGGHIPKMHPPVSLDTAPSFVPFSTVIPGGSSHRAASVRSLLLDPTDHWI